MFKHSNFQFAKIPAGIFVMGSPLDEEGRFEDEKQHLVALIHPFEMMRWPVTTGLYNYIMNRGEETASRLPKVNINWDEACDFCRKLSELDPEHYYRLPTEAEWEYACRAGTTGPHYDALDDIAWYFKNSEGKIHEVGLKKPNQFGLYDMLGNVWEWCFDEYEKQYNLDRIRIIDKSIININPTGPSSGSAQVFRGGSWNYDASYVRAAIRLSADHGYRGNYLGLRPVRTKRT